MVSGYEKSPDYGGPNPPKWFWVLAGLIIIGGPILIAVLVS